MASMLMPFTHEKKGSRLVLTLPAEMHAAIKAVAEAEDRTVNYVVRRMITSWLKQNGAPVKRAKK